MSGPCSIRTLRIASTAAGPATTRGITASSLIAVLEEAQRLGAVADQQVLGLGIVLQHHLMVLPSDAGDLVSAKRSACRIEVIAVGPDPPGLEAAAHAVGTA